MLDSLIFFFVFYILLISVIGYGILFQNFCFEPIKSLKEQKAIYLGFYGLFVLTFISIVTSSVADRFVPEIGDEISVIPKSFGFKC